MNATPESWKSPTPPITGVTNWRAVPGLRAVPQYGRQYEIIKAPTLDEITEHLKH